MSHLVSSSIRHDAYQASTAESDAQIDSLMEASSGYLVDGMLRILEAAGVPVDQSEEMRPVLETDAKLAVNGIFQAVQVESEKSNRAKRAADSAVRIAQDEARSKAVTEQLNRMLKGHGRG
jgi:hypothetical protein